jgi:hypothetical protein
MFVINATIGSHILKRVIVDTLPEAKHLAKRLSQEKIWKLENNTVFFGDAIVRVYDIDIKKPSNYFDEHILSFSDSH